MKSPSPTSRPCAPLAAALLCVSLATPAAVPAEELVGSVTREEIEAAHPDWVQAEVAAAPDAAAAQALAAVPPGAEVTVVLGTWCSDSAREVPRLWRSLDEAGGEVPFALRYVAIDEEKKAPAEPIAHFAIEFVPTVIVVREGHEVGRIVEVAPHGIEKDLLALLTGMAHGVLSASRPAEAPQSR